MTPRVPRKGCDNNHVATVTTVESCDSAAAVKRCAEEHMTSVIQYI